MMGNRYSVRRIGKGSKIRWAIHFFCNSCTMKCTKDLKFDWDNMQAQHDHHPVGWMAWLDKKPYKTKRKALEFWGPIIEGTGLKLE